MPTSSVTLETADGDDIGRVESLLKTHGLPYQDVRHKAARFFLAYDDTTRIGIGGVELYGSNGLLRSVVVTEPNRGQGYGAALCNALETYARNNGVRTLYLLTTTAATFFRQVGYEEIARENVPPSIEQTAEFTEYCPSSAVCMRKHV